MRLPLMSTLLLLTLSAGASRASENEPVTLKLRSPADIGPAATAAQGPQGEPATEVAGGAAVSAFTLLVCDNPAISSHQYVVRGRVKYQDVAGDGYLELLNDFGDKGTFFTRSLGGWGPMKKLSGTSDWRDFELPFYAEPGMKPERLTLNVVLPGAGTVTVSEPLVITPILGQWWTEPQAGLIGGYMGASMGILGGTIGMLAGWSKTRRLAIGLGAIAIAISAVLLIAGLVAMGAGQPYYVYYPLLLIGGVGVGVLGFNLPNTLRRCRADELRRMTASDVV